MEWPIIVPIEIRPGEFVRIAGIPHDLKPDEAEKVSRVILALALPPPPQKEESNR